MAQKKKLVLRKSGVGMKILLVLLIALSITALVTVRHVRGALQSQTEEKRREASALEQENAALESRMEDLDSVDTIRDIAREELGLVDPDTIIISEQ